jgi:fumarate reductase flavoprotein subunit
MEDRCKRSSFSRRAFLQSTALVGGAVIGSAIIGEREANGDIRQSASLERGVWVDTERTVPIPPVSSPKAWDGESEFLIVGTGGAGLAAAARLGIANKSVIVIEKAQSSGGASKYASVLETDGGTRLHDGWGLISEPFDPEIVTQHYIELFQYTADSFLIREFAYATPQMIDWFLDLGMELMDQTFDAYGVHGRYICGKHVYREEGKTKGSDILLNKYVTDFLYDTCAKHGVSFHFNTTVEALVVEGDRVVGVKCIDHKGEKESYYKGSKAVIIAAGGFAANKDMQHKYIPEIGIGAATFHTMPTDTGECIRMGQGVGADIAGLGSHTTFDGGVDWGEAFATHHGYYDGVNTLSRGPWLHLDVNCERLPYVNTTTPNGTINYNAFMDLATIQMNAPSGRTWVVFDDNWEENTLSFNLAGNRYPLTDEWSYLDKIPDWLTWDTWTEGVNNAISLGVVRKADTLKELAVLCDLDEDRLAAQVEKWNSACEMGKDDPLYGYLPSQLIPIKDGPFYAIKHGGSIECTHCGLRVDRHMAVLDKQGKRIPGLYAGMHTAGGQAGCGMRRSISGDVASSLVSGYIAAGYLLDEPSSVDIWKSKEA